MYDKDFLKQLLHPKHLHDTPNSVKHNKREIEKERKEFSINKLAKNRILRKHLKLSFFDGDQKEIKNVNVKNADKDVMNYIQPKTYVSPLSSGNNTHIHSLKHVKSNYTKVKMPTHVVDTDIKIVKTHNMFDWFPKLVNKVHKEGINMTGKIPHAQGEVIKKLKIGNEEVYSYIKPDGSIKMDVRSPHASYPDLKSKTGIFTMEYVPPKINSDKNTDVIMHTPASFKFHENRAHPTLGNKHTHVHPNIAISDTTPLESKLTGRHVSALRYEKSIKSGKNINPDINSDLKDQLSNINKV
jgi:hypothetical protein